VISFVLYFVGLAALVWAAVDIAWQIFTNREGLSSSSLPARVFRSTEEWQADMMNFVTTGGSVTWLPSL